MPKFVHDRKHFRIEYPPVARPTFYCSGQDGAFPVVDVCESGFRFQAAGLDPGTIVIGRPLGGSIQFGDGESLPVRGAIVRIQAGEVAVHLNEQPLPFKRIMEEQLSLRRRFPYGAN